MTNRLRTAAALLSRTLQRVAGETVIYRRGTEAVELTAVISRADGAAEESRDFLLRPADLVLDGQLVEPAVNDVIDHDDGTVTRSYDVCPVVDGGGCFEYGALRETLRVHGRPAADQATAKRTRRITIQHPTEAADRFVAGKTWADLATVWASIEPLTGDEKWAADQVEAMVSHRIRIAYRAGVTSAMRIVYGTRTFNIAAVLNPNEANVELEILATESL